MNKTHPKIIKSRGRIAILDNRPSKPPYMVVKAVENPWKFYRNKYLFVKLHNAHTQADAEQFYNSLDEDYFTRE